MRLNRPAACCCLLAGIITLAGCDASATGRRLSITPDPAVMPGLVMPAQDWHEYGGFAMDGPDQAWLESRNDGQMGAAGNPSAGFDQRFEIDSCHHLWTVNGWPRESSRTTIRTIQRGRSR